MTALSYELIAALVLFIALLCITLFLNKRYQRSFPNKANISDEMILDAIKSEEITKAVTLYRIRHEVGLKVAKKTVLAMQEDIRN